MKSVKVKKKTTKKDSGQKNTGDSNKSENTTDVTDATENAGAAKDTDTTGNTNSGGQQDAGNGGQESEDQKKEVGWYSRAGKNEI